MLTASRRFPCPASCCPWPFPDGAQKGEAVGFGGVRRHFAAVSGPYYATMVINAFELETVTLGRMTMPRFEKSQRVNDISLGSLNPYLSMAQRLKDFLPTAIDYYPAEGYSGIAWAGTMYPFVIPRRCTAGTGSAATAGGAGAPGSEEPPRRRNADFDLDVRRHHQHQRWSARWSTQQHSVLSVDSLRGVCALADGQAATHGAGRDGRDDRNRFCRRVRRVFYRRGLSDGGPIRSSTARRRRCAKHGIGTVTDILTTMSRNDGEKGHDGAGDVCASD